jgi:DNA-directed RNA polymerase subunit RPC12/RpoP
MEGEYVACDRCGAVAIVKSVEGIWNPSEVKSGVTLFLVIKCPTCGQREQAEASLAAVRSVPR